MTVLFYGNKYFFGFKDAAQETCLVLMDKF